MIKSIKALWVSLVLSISCTANAGLITFETGTSLEAGVELVNLTIYNSAQSPYNPHSGTARAYARADDAGIRFNLQDVIFNGAWFAGGSDVTWELYKNNTLVHISSTLSTSSTPTFLNSGYNGIIDYARVRGTPGYWIFDDVTYNASASVPEPSTLAIFALGIIGLASRRFKK